MSKPRKRSFRPKSVPRRVIRIILFLDPRKKKVRKKKIRDALEKEFGITIPDKELQKLRTVADAIKVVLFAMLRTERR